MRVVELDAELQVFLDDILDRDRWLDYDATRLSELDQQRRRITLDLFLGKVGHKLRHHAVILICIVEIAVYSVTRLSASVPTGPAG